MDPQDLESGSESQNMVSPEDSPSPWLRSGDYNTTFSQALNTMIRTRPGQHNEPNRTAQINSWQNWLSFSDGEGSSSSPNETRESNGESSHEQNEVPGESGQRNTNAANDDQLLGERNLREVREGLEQIRNRLDNTREGQTLVSFFTSTFPFVIIFLLKFVGDHLFDIGLILFIYTFFIQADYHVKKIFIGGMPSKIFRLLYVAIYTSLVFWWISIGSVDDFDFTQLYSINFSYFLGSDYAIKSMSYTFYGIVVSDITLKLITIIPKLIVTLASDNWVTPPKKRRLMQFIEYCSQYYRCIVPIGPWWRFLLLASSETVGVFDITITACYTLFKLREMLPYIMQVRKTSGYLFSESSFGTSPNASETLGQMCTVCHDEFSSPIKLECGHIFCKSCIETWLDRNTTCPMCRADVAKDMDNEWKNGGTSRAIRLF